MTTPTRHRYYAYERTDGSVCYLAKILHEGIQRRPHTIGLYHLTRWLGASKLLTRDEFKRMGWLGSERPGASAPHPKQAAP
jgi:hypothetical protein